MNNQLAPRFEAQELIPDWWNHLKVNTVEDIAFLGEVNIRQMIRAWRSTVKGLSHQIKAVDERLTFLQDKTADDIAAEAQKYESPQFKFEEIGLRPGNLSNDPEPLDAASINRERGATTFNVCGWCKYAGGGSASYNYLITTDCTFVTYVGMKDTGQPIPMNIRRRYGQTLALSLQATGGELQAANEALRRMEANHPGIREVVTSTEFPPQTERRFNTPCFLPYAGQELLDQLRAGLAAERDRLITKKRQTDQKIRFLLSLARKAERKPALAHYRPYDWFNLNDPVICYVGKWTERIIPDAWATAQVIDGYRHHDGCVSVRYDKKIHNGDYLEGHGGGYGISRPEVMHAWEYDYLCAHPDFTKVWLDSSKQDLRDFDFDPDQMLDALTTKALPSPDEQ